MAAAAIKVVFCTCVVVLAIGGCGDQTGSAGVSAGASTEVSETTWTGGGWPFTVPRGILGCTKPMTVTFNVNSTVYGLNGTAIDHGYPAVDPIWKSETPGPRADLGPMIQKGLTLCGAS